MNLMMLRRALAVLVRYGLFAFGEWLRRHNVLTSDEYTAFISNETIEQVVSWVLIIGPVAWSIRKDAFTHLRDLVAALHLRPGSSMDDIKAAAKQPTISATALPQS